MDFTSIFTRRTSWEWVLALSYDLGPLSFFESDLLSKIDVKKNITVVLDDSRFRKVLCDSASRPRYWGVLYNVERVKVRGSGIFHPKLFLFLSQDEAVIYMGSANLTKSGFTRNIEALAEVRLTLGTLDDEGASLLGQIGTFLQRSFISGNSLVETASPTLRGVVSEILGSSIFAAARERSGSVGSQRKIFFLSSLDIGLFSQINEICGANYRALSVLSPFYDAKDENMSALLKAKRHAEVVQLFVPTRKSTFPKDAFERLTDEAKQGITVHAVESADKNDRFIHAKYYRFASDAVAMDLVTSANFTMPGLFHDDRQRNLEVGLLFPARSGEFCAGAGILKYDGPGLEHLNIEERGEDGSTTITSEFILESACYVSSRILLQIDSAFLASPEAADLGADLIIDQTTDQHLKILRDEGVCYVQPALEIEGGKSLQIQLVTAAGEARGVPVFVNRERHEPNFLPVMGASAFNQCLRIGGVEGVEKAIELARASGKQDWLIYLLSSWDLEKILRGLQDGTELSDDGEGDDVPSIPSGGKIYATGQIRKNIRTIFKEVDMYQNVKQFLDGVEKPNGNANAIMQIYIDCCFPLFVEIAQYFTTILIREEEKKRANPGIGYPDYTWLENFKKYVPFATLICRKISMIYEEQTSIASDLKMSFIDHAQKWYRLHSGKTCTEMAAKIPSCLRAVPKR